MCGIAAYIPTARGRAPQVTSAVLSTLALNNLSRGEHSTGIGVLCDGPATHRFRLPVDATRFFLNPYTQDRILSWAPTARVWLLHTRFATQGDVSRRNAHPHRVGPVTIVHNGHVSNWRAHRKGCSSECDSESIASVLASADPNDASSYTTAFEQLSGTFAVLAYDKRTPNVLHVFRAGNPLRYAYTPWGMVFSSESVRKESVVVASKAPKLTSTWHTVDDSTYFTVNLTTRKFSDGTPLVMPYAAQKLYCTRFDPFDYDDYHPARKRDVADTFMWNPSSKEYVYPSDLYAYDNTSRTWCLLPEDWMILPDSFKGVVAHDEDLNLWWFDHYEDVRAAAVKIINLTNSALSARKANNDAS